MSKLVAHWTKVAASTRLQRSSQCLSIIGSRAWIFGGEILPREPVDSRFDVITIDVEGAVSATTLEPKAGLVPTPRVGSATAVVNDALYMFSGRGGIAMEPIEEKGAVWQYDPTQSAWGLIQPADPSAPYPTGRSYHAMTSDQNENIYIHAGCPEKGRLSDLWSFNIKSKTWTELEAAPWPPRGGTSITAYKDKLYRMNGFDGEEEQGGKLDVYDMNSNKWSTVSFQADGVNGPSARSVGTLLPIRVGELDYLVTVFGEGDPSSLGHAGAGKMRGDGWAYGLDEGVWTWIEPQGETPAPRGWFDADIMQAQSGRQVMVVHGGLAEDNSRLGDVWKLEISNQ